MDIYTEKLEKKLKQYQGETQVAKVQATMMVQQMGIDREQKRLEEKKQYEKELRELAEKVKKSENALKALSGRADDMESLLGLYRRSLMHYAFMRGEQGHVISVQKDGGLLVVLNPLVELHKPYRGLVINRKGTVIAQISIAPKGGMAHASVIRKMANVPVSPFDMIIVEK
jgi:predicted  nucleic acid-binding Zn-ribbon protein